MMNYIWAAMIVVSFFCALATGRMPQLSEAVLEGAQTAVTLIFSMAEMCIRDREVRVPTETVTEIKDNKRRDVERKIFPGYVLVKMVLTDESWYVVRNIRGCTGFVGPSSKPIPLTDEEVATVSYTHLDVYKRQPLPR